MPYLIPVPPCRSLCEKVMSECASTISEFDLELPAAMMCDQFPSQDEHACIPIQSHQDPLPPGTLRWNEEKSDAGFTVVHSAVCPLDQRAVFENWKFMDLEYCTQPCKPMHHQDSDTMIIRLVVGMFATLTTVVSAFGIFIFMREKQR